VLPTKLTNSPSTGGLAFTGASVAPLLLIGSVLLGAGVLFALAGRRPTTRRRH
jgi:hypothetical protein